MKIATFDNALVALGVIAASAALIVYGSGLSSQTSPDKKSPVAVENWRTLAASESQIGDSDATVKIVEFADFQCPYCARLASLLDETSRDYPHRFVVLFRHFPLTGIHPHAYTAAIAAECAGRFGKFAAYHNELYRRQSQVGIVPWDSVAQSVGIRDLRTFKRCVDRNETRARVDSDIALAHGLGLDATPTVIINGRLYPNGVTMEDLRAMTSAAVAEKPRQ